ncbi:MAG: hypothetical protein AAB316_00175, partial [Bacteroidota bacterium]
MKNLLFLLLLAQSSLFAQNMPALKLFRHGNIGSEKPGVVSTDGKMLDVSAFGEDYNEAFFEKNGLERLAKWLESNATRCPQVPESVRIASCVARPSKIIGIGLNYAKHAAEAGQLIPKEPIIFQKASTS